MGELLRGEIQQILRQIERVRYLPWANLVPIDAYARSEENQKGQWEQVWLVNFGCTKCGKALDFMLVRKGAELKIAGRFPIEVKAVDLAIPEVIRDHISKGYIAADTGFTLAGLFYLRVAIEQFFRSQRGVMKRCAGPKPTGDELGDAYGETLPALFKETFPSLKLCYANISGALHGANSDRELFDNSLAAIVKHFQARVLFELKDVGGESDKKS